MFFGDVLRKCYRFLNVQTIAQRRDIGEEDIRRYLTTVFTYMECYKSYILQIQSPSRCGVRRGVFSPGVAISCFTGTSSSLLLRSSAIFCSACFISSSIRWRWTAASLRLSRLDLLENCWKLGKLHVTMFFNNDNIVFVYN